MNTTSGIGDATGATRNSEVKLILAEALIAGERGASAADRLCHVCLSLLGVDAAAISLIDEGVSRGTFGASDEDARVLDELQFTCGEGPCLEAAHTMTSIFVPDLQSKDEPRWPAFKDAAERADIRAVFAIPIRVGKVGIGALDLFRRVPGPLSTIQMADSIIVADAAAQVLLDVTDRDATGQNRAEPLEQWDQLVDLARIDVYQATGMVMAQLDVSPAEALIRLRAYAFANEQTANDIAQLIISRQLRLEP